MNGKNSGARLGVPVSTLFFRAAAAAVRWHFTISAPGGSLTLPGALRLRCIPRRLAERGGQG